ncbi:MAG: hypothetical protein ACT4NP_04985 [Pseudonocardiales bacterium]
MSGEVLSPDGHLPGINVYVEHLPLPGGIGSRPTCTGSTRWCGRIAVVGTPAEVLTEETVHEVFGWPCRVIPDPVSGTPLVVPLGGSAKRAHR